MYPKKNKFFQTDHHEYLKISCGAAMCMCTLTLLPHFFQNSKYAMGFLLLPLVSKKEYLPLFSM